MPRRLGRRRFLQVSAGAALAGVAYGTLGITGVQPRSKPTARRVLTKEFHLGPSELAKGSHSGLTVGTGGLKLGRGRNVGHLLSPILESDLLFNYVGLFWSSSNPDGSSVAFWVRTSPDGRSWSPWQTVQVEMPPGPLAEYDTYGALIWADRANYVQFLGELRGASEKPGVSRIGLTLLNPYDGPVLETAADLSDGGFVNTAFAAEADSHLETGAAPAAAIGKPITFRREDWGADESLRFSGGQEIWPREYVPTKKLVVHHTATGNSYATVEDAKALVRAIYTYHAVFRDWGDIGYNSLIDKFGNSYEGRRGRDGPGYDGPGGREILSEDVVAGHASSYNHGSSGISLLGTFCSTGECSGGGSPTAAMLSRLKDVLAWECQQHRIDPETDSDFLCYDGTWHRDLPNLVGHRDVGSTTCPGDNVYALLPQLRRDVAARLTGWFGWDCVGGVLNSGPAVSSWGPGRLDVFALGTDDKLRHKWYVRGKGWSRGLWENLGAPSGLTLTSDSDIGAVSWGDGRIDVFAAGPDSALWHRWYVRGEGWSGWENLGGILNSGPAVSSWAEGRLDVFALGEDNKLRHKWYVRGQGWLPQGPWENLGAPPGGLNSDPSAVSWGDGRIDVFVRASDDALWHRWYARGQGWSRWESLGGTLNSGPDVSSWAEGRLDVFALGTDDRLRHKWYVRGQGWLPKGLWENLGAPPGGLRTSDPAAVSWGDGRIDVFVRASDDALWHRWHR